MIVSPWSQTIATQRLAVSCALVGHLDTMLGASLPWPQEKCNQVHCQGAMRKPLPPPVCGDAVAGMLAAALHSCACLYVCMLFDVQHRSCWTVP